MLVSCFKCMVFVFIMFLLKGRVFFVMLFKGFMLLCINWKMVWWYCVVVFVCFFDVVFVMLVVNIEFDKIVFVVVVFSSNLFENFMFVFLLGKYYLLVLNGFLSFVINKLKVLIFGLLWWIVGWCVRFLVVKVSKEKINFFFFF